MHLIINKNIRDYIDDAINTYLVKSELIKILKDIRTNPDVNVLLHMKHTERKIRLICRAILTCKENTQ